MKVWVTRDRDNTGDICGWNDMENVKMDDTGFWDAGEYNCNQIISFLESLHPSQFKKMFGFTPRKGSCRQYELSLKEIVE